LELKLITPLAKVIVGVTEIMLPYYTTEAFILEKKQEMHDLKCLLVAL
jgi:hypothetical protein